MNASYYIFLLRSTFFILSFETQFIVSNYSYTYQGITYLTASEMFLVKYSCKNSYFLKKGCRCDVQFAECWFRTQSQERKKIHIFIGSSLYFIYSGKPDLALGESKILIPLCFMLLQPAV